MATVLQSVLFDKRLFTPAEARAWLDEHGLATPPAHETSGFFRYRQVEPSLMRGFRFINLKKGVKAVIGRYKNDKR